MSDVHSHKENLDMKKTAINMLFLVASMPHLSAAVGRASQKNECMPIPDFVSHPGHERVREGRPDLVSGYTGPRCGTLKVIEQHQVNWKKKIVFSDDGNGCSSAHFALHVNDLSAEQSVGVVLYIASAQSQADGTYDVRIEIEQKRPEATIKAYTSDGVLLTGPVPLVPNPGVNAKKPFLPWLDGMKQFYSILCGKAEGTPYLLVVQHTREAIGDYATTTPFVDRIIDRYALHPRLQNRPHGYLENSLNMRCLPFPFSQEVYGSLVQGEMKTICPHLDSDHKNSSVAVSVAITQGIVDILPW